MTHFLHGNDIEQYSRVRILEYTDYSSVKLLKFKINGLTNLANWSITINTTGQCTNYFANIHFILQHNAYPLIAPKNESFPETYITTRHDLIRTEFNRTVSNKTVEVLNPLSGTWFALAYVQRLSFESKSKIAESSCDIYLTTWLDYQPIVVPLTLNPNKIVQFTLSTNITSVYASFYTSLNNSQIKIQSEWFSNCDIIVLVRINALPSKFQYDYQTVCRTKPCSIEIEQLSDFIWIYLQISSENLTCLNNPIQGNIWINSTECELPSHVNNCIQTYKTQRIMFSSYYDFTYIVSPNTNNSVTFYGNDSSVYSYEFLVDDLNIGGTIHLEFKPSVFFHINSSVYGCLSKYKPNRYFQCENNYKININNDSTSSLKSLPYPEMGNWYLTLEYSCNRSKIECLNSSISVLFRITSSACTREQCGKYGYCRLLTSQQNLYSTCTCVVGYRGYGCTDSSQSYLWRYLPSVLFLTLSNLMFIPSIVLAVYYKLYIEGLVYFFNMFFSTFYHACDQDINQFCIFKYDGLQLSDFIGSYSSFVITLITMSIIPRSVKIFLFMVGLLTCIAINSRDRFDRIQAIVLIVITFCFTIFTWIFFSIKHRRLQPPLKRLLFTIPGFILSIVGIILFSFIETDDNYWYTHSLWHIFMAGAILFFLPNKIGEKRSNIPNSNTNTSISDVEYINQGASVDSDGANNHSHRNE